MRAGIRIEYACGLDGKYCLLASCPTCHKLFLAAPEMLAVLRDIKMYPGSYNRERLAAAISKAESE